MKVIEIRLNGYSFVYPAEADKANRDRYLFDIIQMFFEYRDISCEPIHIQ